MLNHPKQYLTPCTHVGNTLPPASAMTMAAICTSMCSTGSQPSFGTPSSSLTSHTTDDTSNAHSATTLVSCKLSLRVHDNNAHNLIRQITACTCPLLPVHMVNIRDGIGSQSHKYTAFVHAFQQVAEMQLPHSYQQRLIKHTVSGAHRWFKNSPLAEQKNAILGKMCTQASFLKQTTFLWYLCYVVYRMNKLQREVHAGKCFWIKPPKPST